MWYQPEDSGLRPGWGTGGVVRFALLGGVSPGCVCHGEPEMEWFLTISLLFGRLCRLCRVDCACQIAG